MEISVFGELNILVDGVDIAQPIRASRKKMMLLEFLILNSQKPVSAERLAEVIWREDEEIDAENTLKTLVSRLRKDLEDNGITNAIVTTPGGYMWDPEPPAKIDAFRMEEICNAVLNAESLTLDVRDQLEELLSLYTGDLLPDSGLDIWIASKSYYYHDLYLDTVYRYINFLKKEKAYEDIIRICKIALDIDPFDSTLNLELMSALAKIGKIKEMSEQYREAANQQYAHFESRRPEEISNFYKESIKDEKDSEAEIEKICKELHEDQPNSGAFVCEHDVFKDIYHLQMRNLRRMGVAVFLALVDVRRTDNKQMEAAEMRRVMSRTLNVMRENLRQGDTVSRYSPLQYVVLLPAITNAKIGRMVIEQIKKLFYSDSKNADYIFSYSVMPLDIYD
ncbi:MAG: AfsR/SARP family transcriptional regulator [Lachnospiraceae bacterium]